MLPQQCPEEWEMILGNVPMRKHVWQLRQRKHRELSRLIIILCFSNLHATRSRNAELVKELGGYRMESSRGAKRGSDTLDQSQYVIVTNTRGTGKRLDALEEAQGPWTSAARGLSWRGTVYSATPAKQHQQVGADRNAWPR
mmetsp:Transcript_101855/g.186544  ORF Transcript_101855/g.186544 Transcript_101855/m.186544 type:complete len:141 (+) Transcript_101855:328-750(+)